MIVSLGILAGAFLLVWCRRFRGHHCEGALWVVIACGLFLVLSQGGQHAQKPAVAAAPRVIIRNVSTHPAITGGTIVAVCIVAGVVILGAMALRRDR